SVFRFIGPTGKLGLCYGVSSASLLFVVQGFCLFSWFSANGALLVFGTLGAGVFWFLFSLVFSGLRDLWFVSFFKAFGFLGVF
ncbi:MAG: hypothetical protein JW729_11080, partial [Bacteroidales bacterium]|nr:hypothetical protein [Bacteroidales bacterium]